MENENSENLVKAINAQTEVLTKLTTVLDAYLANNNQVVRNLDALNKFSAEVITRINNVSLVIDSICVCLFENKLISEKRLEEVIVQLGKQYQQSEKNEHSEEHKCNGECHEEERKGNSSGTESK